MTDAALGAGLGLVGSAGLLLAVTASPPFRRPRLHHRLAPYLRDAPRRSRLLEHPLHPTLQLGVLRLLTPVLIGMARRLDAFVGAAPSVRRRLDRCGNRLTLEQFRIEQVLAAALGSAAALGAIGLALIRHAHVNPVAAAVLVAVAGMTAALARDRALTVEAARREHRMLQEFPTIAELLALAVAAGEGPAGALERVAKLATGELAAELRRALADARAGTSLVAALEAMARRSGVPALARFVDGMAIAVDRGTPLADVLRAQAVDVREQHRRQLLEVGGRKEIAMLAPVVFLVLPVTVVFALFPGFYALSFSVSGDRRSRMRVWWKRASALLVRSLLRDDRGDVPGWVLVTLMTAGIVMALWIVAEPKLAGLLGSALNIAGDPNGK